jgi:hypothetical protein
MDVSASGRSDVKFSAAAATTNLPSCCACSASATTNALVLQITRETVAVFPKPRTRTTLGVGEIVNLILAPNTELGQWQYEDPKTLQQLQKTDSHLGFEAPHAGAESLSTVTFSHPSSGLSASILFSVTEPSSYIASVYSNKKLGLGVAGAYAEIKLIFPPTNVSFYRVQMMEIGMVATDATGWFHRNPDMWTHDKKFGADTPFPLASATIESVLKDLVAMPTPRSWLARLRSSPWKAGTMTWPIPAVWWVDGDTITNSLPWSDQHFSLTSDGTLTIEKFGLPISRGTNDVCVPFP